MTKEDLRVWARHIYVQKLELSVCNLLKWMDEEMTARFRSGAAICKTGSSNRPSVNLLVAVRNKNPSHNHNKTQTYYYVWKISHYVDECKAMAPSECWEILKEQKACFSCLNAIQLPIVLIERNVPKRTATAQHAGNLSINFCTVKDHQVQHKSPHYRTRACHCFQW